MPLIIDLEIKYSKNKNIKEIFSLGNLFVSNFVKKKDVEKFVKNNSRLLLSDRREVLEQMILRLHTDTEFKKRHKIVGFVGSIMLKLRISKMFNINFFSRYSPYMKLEFRKIS